MLLLIAIVITPAMMLLSAAFGDILVIDIDTPLRQLAVLP